MNCIGSECSGLDGDEAGAVAEMAITSGEAALQQLACEYGAIADADDIADEHLAEACGKRGGVVADLVGVGKDHLRWAFLFEKLLQGERVTVRGVLGQQWMFDAHDFGEGFGCGLSSLRCGGRAAHDSM